MNAEQRFLRDFKNRNPKEYYEICKKYPTLGRKKLQEIYEHEVIGCGLLGLQQTRFTELDAESYGFYTEEE